MRLAGALIATRNQVIRFAADAAMSSSDPDSDLESKLKIATVEPEDDGLGVFCSEKNVATSSFTQADDSLLFIIAWPLVMLKDILSYSFCANSH